MGVNRHVRRRQRARRDRGTAEAVGADMQVPAQSPRAPRQRALLNARVSFADGQITIPCTVTQISDTGAKVSIDESVTLPDRLRIEIFQRGLDTPARLVWRRGREAGFEFVTQKPVETGLLREYADKIHALEAEIVTLRGTISALKSQLKVRADEP